MPTYTSDADELRQKVAALCVARYGSNTVENKKKLFASYDSNGDGKLDADELNELLADANVGSAITRRPPFGACGWVCEIFKKVDKNPEDGLLSWEEYLAASSVDDAPPVIKPGGAVPASPTAISAAGDVLGGVTSTIGSAVPSPVDVASNAGSGSVSSALPRVLIGVLVGGLFGHWVSR